MKINGIEITGITDDSRKVRPGWAFFAINGRDMDATRFIPNALAAGAAVVVTDENYDGESFKVPNIRRFLGECCVKFFQPIPENIIAVTGTAGKTSVVHFCRHILEQLGKNAASIGSIGLIHKGIVAPMGVASNTTPNPILMCDVLHKLKAQGCDYVAIEASSTGIDQERMTLLPIKIAGFTNFSRDHISDKEHKDMAEYFAAKKRLFADVLPMDGIAVLNADIPEFAQFADIGRTVISYGENGRDIKLLNASHSERGQKIKCSINGRTYEYELGAAGKFQTPNSLCAIGMVMAMGFDPEDIVRAISGAPAPDGRMQFVGSPVEGGGVYIDYAHTSDALEKLLMSVREICRGRLMLLFGAGGDRDPARRVGAGRAAQEAADVVYITDDNPRTEDPAKIRAQIAVACPKGIVIDGGRAAAIRRAIADMRENDLLIIAGKGHEDYQICGATKIHFSDFEESAKAIAELKK